MLPRILRALFVVYVAATALHVGWVVAHEPFAFDAWNVAIDTHAEPITFERFREYWWFEFTHSNPRVGQALTYLSYKLDEFAVIATPLAFVALSLAVTVLGLGRFPRWKRGRDLAVWSIAIGFSWFALPQIGKTLFCRAYCANYVYGAAIQLWFLATLRLVRTTNTPVASAAYGVLGLVAGACNEHTGPALCLFSLGYAARLYRSGARRAYLAWSGALGAVVGFAIIFFAPGQDERYDGLVQKTGLAGRLIQRGVTGNLEIVRDLVLAAAPLLAMLVIAIIAAGEPRDDTARAARRRAFELVAIAMAAGVVVAMTLFVSPKLGPRFFLAAMAMLLAGFVAYASVALSTKRLAPFVALAVVASIYAATRTVGLYDRLARDGAARVAALEVSPRGSVFTAEAFEQVDDSWWFLGDDFRDIRKREMVAAYFNLAGVVFRAFDVDAPLGVTDVRLVPRLSPPDQIASRDMCPASSAAEGRCGSIDASSIQLAPYRGFDVATIHHAFEVAIEQRRVASARVDAVELAVEFAGERPKLPRDKLLVARWRRAGYDGWTATLTRGSLSRERTVVVPAALPRDFEVYVYALGDELRRLGTARDELHFTPWRSGAYWVLACGVDECFVISASRQAR